MTDQPTSRTGGRRPPVSRGAHRPRDAAAFERITPLALELSALGGAAPTPGTVLALLRLLVRVVRLLRRPHLRQPW